MKKLLLSLGCVGLVLLLWASPGWSKGADEAVGSVVAVRGEVKAVSSQGERPLATKSEVFQADTIRTGKGGRVQLHFADNTIVSLGDNTVLEIAKYHWDAAKQEGAMKTRVEEGTFRVLGGLITKTSPKNFSTETPAATIGIRGSMYAGSFRDNRLQVAFLGGRGIYVSNQQGRVEIDRAGFGTRVTTGNAPEPPARMNAPDAGGLVEGLQDEGTATGTAEDEGGTAGEGAAETGTTGDGTTLSPENAELLDPGTGGFVDTSALAVAVDQSANVVVTASDSAATTTVVAAVATSSSASAGMSGWSQSFLRTLSGNLVEAPRIAVTATSVNGFVGDGTGLQPFTMAAYNPAAAYASWGIWLTEPISLSTALGVFPGYRYVGWDDKGEFFVYLQEAYASDYSAYYESLAFAGVPTTTALPTMGVDYYFGFGLGDSIDPVSYSYSPGGLSPIDMSINWANRKVFGIVDDSSGDFTYYYGNIDAPSSIRFVSGENWSGTGAPGVATTTGIVDFSQFYGSEYQGFGFTAHGIDYDLATMTANENWQAAGALFREPGLAMPSPTGTQNWTGFYIGMSDNLSSPTSSAIFQNTLALNLDAAAGTVSGTMNYAPIPYYPVAIPFGGAGRSAYVDNQNFIAEFIPGTYPGMVTANVKSPGSFLVTAGSWDQFSAYASWGYWNLVDGTSQVHSPGSFWVAGLPTPALEVDNLVATSFTGAYNGPAYGVATDATNARTPLTNGTTGLTFNFATGAINGAIGFTEVTLPVAGTASLNPTTASFNAYNVIGGATTSSLQGGFFGPGAATMAGTFDAQTAAGHVSGIFGGNR